MALQIGASQGWARCGHPRRHFFRSGHAICNRNWLSGGAPLEVSDVPGPLQDCRACRRLRDREIHPKRKARP
jgi:hypothetical protein